MQFYLIIFIFQVIIYELLHQNLILWKIFILIILYLKFLITLLVWIYTLIEIKRWSGEFWNKLLEQIWKQADVAKNDRGRLWAIGQKAFEICFFRFDSLKYEGQVPDWYTNFDPLNLNNLTGPKKKKKFFLLVALNVKFEYCEDHGSTRIALIKWRLDNKDHIPYINQMFEYIRRLEP